MGARFTEYDREKIRLVEPIHDELLYNGRVDISDPDAPVFIQPGSFVRMEFTGSTWVKAVVINKRRYGESWVGALIDKRQNRVRIPEDEKPVVLTLAEDLEKGKEHELTFFKRMDQCHEYQFLGFLLEYGARVEKGRKLPRKKIEFYGDSVTAGEVSEALEYCKKEDPQHNGEYSNAYFSFAWATARLLHARVHLVAQGGIALRDGTGYFRTEELGMGNQPGMESCYDKISFYPEDGRENWDFDRYTPHVVVVALGQNDAYPQNYMKEEPDGERAAQWKAHYKSFVLKLREIYPRAWIVLMTTTLMHHPSWDRAIGRVCSELRDPKITHFLFSENGRGTPGHIRASEAMTMALELSGYINGLSQDIWE